MGNFVCYKDEDANDNFIVEPIQNQSGIISNASAKNYKLLCTKVNFKNTLKKLTQLPYVESSSNMLSITGKGDDKFCPELFQIYQVKENHTSISYYYAHLEEGTHNRLDYFKIENVNDFELSFYNPKYTIELINGENGVLL
jgi:hypothetical protein